MKRSLFLAFSIPLLSIATLAQTPIPSISATPNTTTASNPVSYLPLFQTLVGGLLTFAGGLLGTYLIQRAQRRAETESLASAFYGEITASLLTIERRQYIQILETKLEELKKEGKREFSYFEITESSFGVYENNIGKIGLLPNPLPEKIFIFYGLLTTALYDLASLNKLKSDDEYKTSRVEQYFLELITDLGAAVISGKDIQSQIRSHFKRIGT